MTTLIAEDKPPRTEQVDLRGVNPEGWAQGRVGRVAGASPVIVRLKPERTQPTENSTLSVTWPSWALPHHTGPN